jgi:hypothetical protein
MMNDRKSELQVVAILAGFRVPDLFGLLYCTITFQSAVSGTTVKSLVIRNPCNQILLSILDLYVYQRTKTMNANANAMHNDISM